jgi:hypothetical protein
MSKQTLYGLLAIVFFLGTIAVNALANLLPINGLNTGQVSALYPSLFTPAGTTFLIWNVIYLLLAGFVVVAWHRRREALISQLLPLFIITCISNMTWIIAWHYLFIEVSMVLMLTLLAVLTRMFLLLYAVRLADWKGRVFIRLPFILYFAWICVATIANASALLVSYSWKGGPLSPEAWAIIMMTVASLLALLIAWKYRTPAFVLVVIWALLGIYLRWRHTEHVGIVYTAAIEILLLGVVFIVTSRHARRQAQQV